MSLPALAAGLALAAQEIPETVRFAAAQFQTWRTEARTEVELQRVEGADRPLPVVREVRCRASTANMQVDVDRRGRFSMHFGIDGDDGEPGFTTTNVRSLWLDRTRYEAQAVQTLHFRWRFADVTYPTSEDIILPLFQGYLAVRQAEDHPWMDVTTLLDELMEGRALRLGFGDMVDGRLGPLVYRTVSLRGLREALVWCGRQIRSDRAYRLHQG